MIRQGKLGDFVATRSRGIAPASTPDETFELYSVPAFEGKRPEVVTGDQIGSNKQIVDPGTVLLCKINPRINRAWTVGSFTKHQKIASTEWITFPPHPDLEPRYLAHYLSRREIRDFLAANASGVGGSLMRVRASTIKDLPLPLPSVDAQRRIVAEIEKQFSRLDEAIANLKRAKASIARYEASVLSEATALGGRWTACSLADLLRERIVNGLSVKESTTPTSVRALRLSAMTESGLNYADHRFLPVDPDSVDDILIEEGDFFVSRGNGSLALVGRGATAQTPPFPVIFPDTMMRLRFADAEVRRWVAIIWPSRTVRRQIEQRVKTTAGIYKIAQPQVASISVPLPSASELERVVVDVDRRLSMIHEIKSEIDANLKRAQALRHAVLMRGFS